MNFTKAALCAGVIAGAILVGSHVPAAKGLPHRSIHEIDLQGHQDKAPQHACAAVYDAPRGDLDLCFGVVTPGVAGTTYSNDATTAPPATVIDADKD